MKRTIFYILTIIALIISTLSSALSFIINITYLGVILLICAYISGILFIRVKKSYQA